MITRIKICCIKSEHEARMAIEYGASAVGLVASMPSGPGPISDEFIRQIAQTVPPPVATFLLTCETSVKEIIKHHKRTLTNTILNYSLETHPKSIDSFLITNYNI